MNPKAILLILSVFLTVFAFAVPRDKCILEIGTGTWCQFCPGASMAADDIEANGLDVAIIEYHNNDPYTNAASNARNNYYEVPGWPTAYFDGLLPFDGGDHTASMYSYYLPRINTRLARVSSFTLAGTANLSGNSLLLQGMAQKVGANTSDDIKLHMVVTESNIHVVWQGQNHVSFVERAMYPNANGTSVSFDSNSKQTVTGAITLSSNWVRNNMEVVVFLQDNTTKEILQGTKFSFSDISKIPTSLTAELNSENHVVLNWCAPTEIPMAYGVYKNDEFLDFTEATSTTFTDPEVFTGTASYKVNALFEAEESLFSLEAVVLPVDNHDAAMLPVIPSVITSIYPNPFNPETRISYTLQNSGSVQISIYNLLGQKIRQVVNTNQVSGTHIISWDGKDELGNGMSSGIYFVRMDTKDSHDSKKIMLLK